MNCMNCTNGARIIFRSSWRDPFFLLGCIVFASTHSYNKFLEYTPFSFNVTGPFSRSRAGAELIRHEMWSLSTFLTRSPLRIAEVIPVTIRKLSIVSYGVSNKIKMETRNYINIVGRSDLK